MTKPFSPEEAKNNKINTTPDVVIQTFNELITKNLLGGTSVVKQEDVLVVLENVHEMNRREIFDNNWLSVEDIYRAQGWKVVYDKPGFNENYPATFTFSKR